MPRLYHLLLSIFMLPCYHQAQSLIVENFHNGQWQSTAWYGDTGLFQFHGGRLALRDSAAGSAGLFHPSEIMVNAVWELHGQLDFNPSSSNYLNFWLMGDHSVLDSISYGYFLSIGGNSKDEIRLYRKDHQNLVLLAQSNEDFLDQATLYFHCRVERDSLYNWSVFADTGQFHQWQLISRLRDSSHRYSEFCGLSCHYTKTRSDRFYLDSIYIQGQREADQAPPQLVDWHLDSNLLTLYFNEKLAPESENAQFQFSPALGHQGAHWEVSDAARLTCRLDTLLLPNTLYDFSFQGVVDPFGNASRDSIELLRRWVIPGDLRINEIMADPSPKVDLNPNTFPELEYLELYNNSDLDIPLQAYHLRLGQSYYELPAAVVLKDSFLVLSAIEYIEYWPPQIAVAGLSWPLSALKNDGANLELYSPEGRLLESVSYRVDWHKQPIKRDGGWSLERLDPKVDCQNNINWRSSQNPAGGSPGRRNSIAQEYFDSTQAALWYYELAQIGVLDLHYSRAFELREPLLQLSGDLFIDSLRRGQDLRHWSLYFNPPLEEGQLYTLGYTDSLMDCSGTKFLMPDLSFGLAVDAEPGTVFISEVLFNPLPGGSDFMEIWNRGQEAIDLADLRVATWDEETGQLANWHHLSTEHRIIPPHGVLALSENPSHLQEHYSAAPNNLQISDLPSLPDKGAALVLMRHDLEVLDRIALSEEAHFPFLASVEGVSLERLDFSRDALSVSQWQSSPAAYQYATPGWLKSPKSTASNTQWTCQPDYLSPNGDGYNDWISFSYQLAQSAWVQVGIYDRFGHKLKDLSTGEQVPASGQFIWQGRGENGDICESGLYIALLEYRYPSGKMGRARCTFVLSEF